MMGAAEETMIINRYYIRARPTDRIPVSESRVRVAVVTRDKNGPVST